MSAWSPRWAENFVLQLGGDIQVADPVIAPAQKQAVDKGVLIVSRGSGKSVKPIGSIQRISVFGDIVFDEFKVFKDRDIYPRLAANRP